MRHQLQPPPPDAYTLSKAVSTCPKKLSSNVTGLTKTWTYDVFCRDMSMLRQNHVEQNGRITENKVDVIEESGATSLKKRRDASEETD